MKKYFFLIPPPRMLRRASFILILFCIPSCKEDPPVIPPPPQPKLTITLEDVSCTETWLNLKLENITLPVNLELREDSTVIKTFFSFNSSDTTLYIDSLLPNQTYNFIVSHSGLSGISSNELSVTTLDTTSHNFTWQTFEFGQHSSSVLYDVAIIDENNIWAVGEIFMNDSLGNPDPHAYNAVHWNGNDWELKRILYNGGFWTIKTIYAFNENDIWFSAFVRYQNGQFVEQPIPGILIGWGINKLWGGSSSDLYAVGNNGNIAHYNGSHWIKIESGTTLHLYDVWGNFNNKKSKWEVITVGANLGTGPNRIILSLSADSGVTSLITTGMIGSIHGIWFNKTRYYVVGNGVFTKRDIFSSSPWINPGNDLSDYFLGAVEGTENNNIITCGSFGELLHFNGITWKSYQNIFSGILLGEVALKGNTVVTVGFNSTKAFIALGVRD